MPPKIVYGKKRPVAQQQSSFTKFISLEQDVLGEKAGKIETSVGRHKQPEKRLKDAARVSELANSQEDDVVVLEQGMKSLLVEDCQSEGKEFVTKKNKPPKDHNKKRGRVGHSAIVNVESLELDLGALKIDSPAQEEVAGPENRGRPRTALKDQDTNDSENSENRRRSLDRENTEQESTETVVCRVAGSRNPKPKPKAAGVKKAKPESPRRTSPRKKPQSPTPKSTRRPDNLYETYVRSLLSLSDRKQIISFAEWSAELEPYFTITKIAEASYSEVYRLSATSTSGGLKQESVLKVVALKTPPQAPLPCQLHTRSVRDRNAQVVKEQAEREEKEFLKSSVADVLSEVKLLQNLNHIPGFTVFRDLTIVQGRPSMTFNKAWTGWNKSQPRGKKSEFPDPSKKASYDDIQLWAVVEMQDAGTDCEKLMELDGLTSIWEVWDVFWGVCLSIAKAEEACRFEHRDLHLGNICVRSSRTGDDITKASVQDPLRRRVRFTGLEATVIDYTLSRADIVSESSRRSSTMSAISNSTSGSDSAALDTDVAFLDLDKDPALFQGDASEEYQYEIYRYMRGAALHNNPLQSTPTAEPKTPRHSPTKKENNHIRFDDAESDLPRRSPRKAASKAIPEIEERENVWRTFHPKTNLVWAHFLLHKLLNHMAHHGTEPDKLPSKKLLATVQLNAGDDAQKVKKKAVKLYKVLKWVADLLCPVQLGKEDALGSVKELVVMALEERWLRVGDVDG